MFDSKKEKLFDVPKKATSETKNSFLNQGMKKSAETLSGNYAKKYSTTGDEFVDQFGNLSKYREPRKFSEIESDMSVLWSVNQRLCVMFILFIRMITRVTSLFNGEKTTSVQRGGGLKHEGIMRMIWLHTRKEDVFWKNIGLFISVGSWKDIFKMLSYDLQYNGWEGRVLDWEKMLTLIAAGLENPNTTNLVKKYLPQIKSNSKCTTIESQANNIIGKWIASKLFDGKENDSYRKYRALKTNGNAHTWQQLISQGRFLDIDFDSVHGKALLQMVSGKFLKNQGLEDKYAKWIETKPVAKFNGFVHELFQKYTVSEVWRSSKLKNMEPYQIKTLQKQFDGLVETAKKNAKTDTSMIVVRDTSGSMSSNADGINMPAGDIAKALALFFSEMLPDGYFADHWIEFSDYAKLNKWMGETVYDKWNNDNSNYIGGTDFQSVIDLFVKIKSKGVPEEEFPTGIICISDGEFNPSHDLSETNVENAFKKLRYAGFSDAFIDKFKIVLWDLRNNYYGYRNPNFETYGSDVKNVFYFSGYEPSIIAFLTGVEHQKTEPKTAEELFNAAMDQEVLQMVEL